MIDSWSAEERLMLGRCLSWLESGADRGAGCLARAVRLATCRGRAGRLALVRSDLLRVAAARVSNQHPYVPPQQRLDPIFKAGALDTYSEQRRDNAEPWPASGSSWPEAQEGRWAKSHEHFLKE